ncbi:hypothetical protein Tco_0424912 [Tanacetum coccineum]
MTRRGTRNYTLITSVGGRAGGGWQSRGEAIFIQKTTLETQVTPPSVPTEDSKKTQSVSSRQTTHPQDIEGNTQPVVKGFHSPLDEGTRKKQHLPNGTSADLKDPGETFSLLIRDCLPQILMKGFKPPADMEPSTTLVADLLGTDAKYQVDQTQSTRLRHRSLTKNKGERLYEGELKNW